MRISTAQTSLLSLFILVITLPFFLSPQVQAKTSSNLVSDTNTEIQFLVLHSDGFITKYPFLRELMHSFERPSKSNPIQWLIAVSDSYEGDEIYQKLKQNGIRDLKHRTQFLPVNGRTPAWARDFYMIFRSPAKEAYNMKPLGLGQLFPFAGGDLTSDETYVYLGISSIELMVEKSDFKSNEDAIQYLENLFQKKLIILPAKDAHQDRYHMPLGIINGQRTSLLADPVMTLRFLAQLRPAEKTNAINKIIETFGKYGPRFRPEFKKFFNLPEDEIQRLEISHYMKALKEVEQMLKAKGIRIIKIPGIHRKIFQDKPYPLGLYYINMVQDTYTDFDGNVRRKLILPAYRIDRLDQHVKETLLGIDGIHEVRMVPAIREGFLGAGIRCFLQVLGRQQEEMTLR